MTHEQRLKLASELTMQRRIQEHARDRAKRELEHANAEIVRIDDDFMHYVVRGFTDELAAQGTEAQRAETVQLGSVHDGPVGVADAPQGRSND